MMIPVLDQNIEIGSISTFTVSDIQYFQAIVPDSSGIITSCNFKDLSEAQEYIRRKYKESGYVPFSILLESSIRKANLSYRVVGNSIGVSQVSISKWVSGENYPSVHLLWRLANLLCLSNPTESYIYWTKVIDKERR